MSTLSVVRFACRNRIIRNVRKYSCIDQPMLSCSNRRNQSANIHKRRQNEVLRVNLLNCYQSSCYFATNRKNDNDLNLKGDKNLADVGKQKQDDIDKLIFEDSDNLSIFARFKLMYKKYWYVLIPVHVVTSVGWLGGFYYLSKSGVDIPSILQYIHVSDTYINKLQESNMGHYAIAYLCYKVATPVRYAVTLGGTTVSIKYLVQAGHIKPVPTKKELIQMYEDKKADRAKRKLDETDAKN